jgi:hypothetical protein
MLVNHSNSGIQSRTGHPWWKSFTENLHSSRVGRVLTKKDVHQGGFACAILA